MTTLTRKIAQTLHDDGAQTCVSLAKLLDRKPKGLSTPLKQMLISGTVKAFERDGKRYFFISEDCGVLRGTTYREVLEMWK